MQLKHRIKAAHDIGVFCQRLLCAGRPLEDAEVLATLPGLELGSCDAQVTLGLVRLQYIDADAGTHLSTKKHIAAIEYHAYQREIRRAMFQQQ
eukprot:11254805-Heterocapsa_arctica.AAC.1